MLALSWRRPEVWKNQVGTPAPGCDGAWEAAENTPTFHHVRDCESVGRHIPGVRHDGLLWVRLAQHCVVEGFHSLLNRAMMWPIETVTRSQLLV